MISRLLFENFCKVIVAPRLTLNSGLVNLHHLLKFFRYVLPSFLNNYIRQYAKPFSK